MKRPQTASGAPFISLIVPVHNRRSLLCPTLKSIREFRRWTGCRSECIVVDDASTDGTAEAVAARWAEEIASGDLRVVKTRVNLGASGAKNVGAAHARGRWLLFVDSDDLLIPRAARALVRTLVRQDASPVVFFRCRVLETGDLIGPPPGRDSSLDLRSFLNRGTPGECLPALQARAFGRFPYMAALRGGEGLAYAAMIAAFGPAWVSPLVVRRYRTANADRLSRRMGLRGRACALARYHGIFLKRYHGRLMPGAAAMVVLKILYHGYFCGIWRLGRGR
jgi:glycosyltransferase involved in cell wall biosynthesis